MSGSERVVRFGPGNGLVGVLSTPADAERASQRPAVLFWNVGINHHVGPYRIYVELARHLATLGFASLRFDVSGLGDSEFSKDDARDDIERSIGDVQDAMSHLTSQLGIDRFVVVGFCSSVDTAHGVAVRDPRVVGAVFIEGYSYATLGHYLRYPKRLLDGNRWARRVIKKVPQLIRQQAAVSEREMVFVREQPKPAQLRADYRAMVERNARLLFIYAAGDSLYEHRDQLFEFLGDRGLKKRVELEFWPDADHTFGLVKHRRAAVERVGRFMMASFEHAYVARPKAAVSAPS